MYVSSRNLVICDPETEYAARLAAFLNGKRELAFQVKTCKSPDQIREAAGQMPVDILLIADECRELYDMQNDPHELDNLYGREGYDELTAELKSRLLSLQEQYGDPVRFSPDRDKE